MGRSSVLLSKGARCAVACMSLQPTNWKFTKDIQENDSRSYQHDRMQHHMYTCVLPYAHASWMRTAYLPIKPHHAACRSKDHKQTDPPAIEIMGQAIMLRERINGTLGPVARCPNGIVTPLHRLASLRQESAYARTHACLRHHGTWTAQR